MNNELLTGNVLHITCFASEIEVIEEKLEDDKVHGLNIEALWYMSLKVKFKVR